jgi:hypothetical protein
MRRDRGRSASRKRHREREYEELLHGLPFLLAPPNLRGTAPAQPGLSVGNMGFIERHAIILDLTTRKDSMLKKGPMKAVVERSEIKRSYLVPLEAGPNTRIYP